MTPLQHLLDAAWSTARVDPAHDLSIGYRHAVYAALGPRVDAANPTNSIGQRRRAVLAIMTMRHVLSVWERMYPGDERPHRILTYAEQLLRGEPVDRDDIRFFWGWLLDADDPVGWGTIEALNVAERDESFDPSSIIHNLTDADVDRYHRDTAFFAAMAYANGPPWIPSSSPARRQQFWKWWLSEAVPVAWAAVAS